MKLRIFIVTFSVSIFFILGLMSLHNSGENAFADNESVNFNTFINSKCIESSAEIDLTGKSCEKLSNPKISCSMPNDVQGKLLQPNLNTRQRATDIFSWQEFIALNWPAADEQRGVPDINKKITDTGLRVWETWKETYEVYTQSGQKPPGWNIKENLPKVCQATGAQKLLVRKEKIDDYLDSILQAASATKTLPTTLTDQNGNLVYYEIRMNKTLFDYINGNELYNGKIQVLKNKISLPSNSILIKAAWLELRDPDDKNSFYTVNSCVCENNDKEAKPSNCSSREMGLIGFHIMHKTPSAPQWVWSTFEQVDNLTGTHPSLFNPDCRADNCPPNKQTNPGTPNQVTRLIKIPDTDPDCSKPELAVDNIKKLNYEIRQALTKAGSLFQNYNLINTQWPLKLNNKSSGKKEPYTVFNVRPELLGNTTMETYVQESSSCMGCHSLARTLKPDKFISSDFTFTLNNAQPFPKGADCSLISASESCENNYILPPVSPKSEWDKRNWDKIIKGSKLAENTYELLSPEYVTAKLHCTSCHLNGGGNPEASWWVNMREKYKTTENLQNRINRCFKHSLNGKPICDITGGDCNTDTNMQSLIIYMDWITRKWSEKNTCKSVSSFPKIKPLVGNSENGGKIFKQKCSFCHKPDAMGRYEDDTYFRPALVGPHSFNACAGMSRPEMLARFIHANMPYGSGGQLTDQEAWDIVFYLESQCRPGKGKDAAGDICSKSLICNDKEKTLR